MSNPLLILIGPPPESSTPSRKKFGLGASAVASEKGKPLRCRSGTVAAKVGGKAACVSGELVLPTPSNKMRRSRRSRAR